MLCPIVYCIQSINRFRLYSFSQENSAVNLSIRAFDTNYSVTGLCNRPESEQTLDFSKVLPTSCDLELLCCCSVFV